MTWTLTGAQDRPLSLEPEQSCLECHRELATGPHIHAAAADGQDCATICHQPSQPGRHDFAPLAADLGPLCAECHEPFAHGQLLHSPVAAGQCGECHDPHQSSYPMFLRQPEAKLCAECHDPFSGRKPTHKPVAEGRCSSCHQPHLAEAAKLLLAPAPELCFQCHTPFSEEGSRHDPVEEGRCATCHLPHQAEERGLLVAPQKELCLDCHDSPLATGNFVHGPVERGNCAGCHNPHAAAEPTLLRAGQPELCFLCHNRPLVNAQGRPLSAIKPLFEDEESLPHQPFADGRCTDCHQHHSGEYASLLNGLYPAGFYATYDEAAYAFCFQCHEPGAFANLFTRRDTLFRNGELNLHFRHVNRAKGRTCSSCHSPHSSRQPHLVRPEFVFGTTRLRQLFTKTDTGGRCATACHVEAGYDRVEPVDNRLRTTPWE